MLPHEVISLFASIYFPLYTFLETISSQVFPKQDILPKFTASGLIRGSSMFLFVSFHETLPHQMFPHEFLSSHCSIFLSASKFYQETMIMQMFANHDILSKFTASRLIRGSGYIIYFVLFLFVSRKYFSSVFLE